MPIYRVLVDCDLCGIAALDGPSGVQGFINVKFEASEDRQAASARAIDRVKAQMTRKGFSADEIGRVLLSIDEIEVVGSDFDRAVEESFIYYGP